MFEIHFDLKDGSYFQFAKVINHSKEILQPWQNAMLEKTVFRIDLLGLKDNFTEFTSQQQHGFIFDAIGMDYKYFIQIIQVHKPGQ